MFLATDSADAIDVFKASEFSVRHLALDRVSLFESTWLIEHRMAARALDVPTASLSAAVDLFLLSEGDMFVGSFGGR